MISAPLFRRLAAIMYDGFLLIAIWMLAVLLMVYINNGQAPPKKFMQTFGLAALFSITYFFYAWFWMNGGQTLGMRAWRIQLVSNTPPLRLPQTLIRFIIANFSFFFFGIGYWWALVDKQSRSLHDIISDTKVHLSK